MIFRPELAELVLSGDKVETRRKVKYDQPCRYKAGKEYAVQPGRGQKQVGRIRIREVRWERLGDITDAGAIREGFGSRDEFLDYWRGLYGDVDTSEDVWVVRFELAGGE